MNIKVAHVVRQYYPSVGGLEEVVQNIARYQVGCGQSPSVVTLDRIFRQPGLRLASSEFVNGIPVRRLPFFGSERYPICLSVLKQVMQVDIIHVHAVDFFFDYLALTRAVHGRPMVASTHGGFFHTRFAQRLKKVYFRSVTRASAMAYSQILANSASDGATFAKIVPSEKLQIIENGVNIDKYADMSSRSLKPVLIYFGRWSANKGIEQAIQFLKLLLNRNPLWRLIVAGREYDLTATQLTSLARDAGLAEMVTVVPNPTQDELTALIGLASYFICLSMHEGFGIAPIEAMSAGLTPVLSDIPPFRRLIDESGHGLLVSRGDLQQAADSLLTLHAAGETDYLRRRELIRTCVQRYGWSSAAEKYVQCYRSIMAMQL